MSVACLAAACKVAAYSDVACFVPCSAAACKVAAY